MWHERLGKAYSSNLTRLGNIRWTYVCIISVERSLYLTLLILQVKSKQCVNISYKTSVSS